MASDRHHTINERAYAIWEAEGRPEGRQDEHWHRASIEVETEENIQRDAHTAPSTGPAEAVGEPALRSRPVRKIAAPPDEAGETSGHGDAKDPEQSPAKPRGESAKVAGTARSGAKRDGQRAADDPKLQAEPAKVAGTTRRGGKHPA